MSIHHMEYCVIIILKLLIRMQIYLDCLMLRNNDIAMRLQNKNNITAYLNR